MSEQYDNAGASSSSSLNSSLQDTEDDRIIASILSEEHVKEDRRLGKRLSHLDSIPHTPRVNGVIPDVDDATLDHERLSARLTTYGLAELQVEGDGNCQFRALADQLFRNPEYHKHVRKQVVKQGSGETMLLYKQLQTDLEPRFVCSHPFEILVSLKLFPRTRILLESFGLAFGVRCITIHCMGAENLFSRKIATLQSLAHKEETEEESKENDVPTRVAKRKHWLF